MNKPGSTLVILSPGFPESEGDTTCLPPKQAFVKAVNRVRPDIKIIIIAFQYPFFKKNYSWFGNEVIALGGRSRGKSARLITWLRAWLYLRKIMKHHHVTGLLSFWATESALVGKRFAKFHHLRHLTWISGQDAKENNRYVKWIRPAADELVAMSDFLRKEFLANHHILPAFTIPIGVDPSAFPSTPAKRDIDLMGAGSLISLKQFGVFVEVVNELRKKFPFMKCMICGKGPEQDKLEVMIHGFHLEDHLTLTGELPQPEILALMQRTKIFLHTSAYEGFGSVCIEALYAGAQVVSFVRPMDSWISQWYIVQDKEEMIERIITLLSDDQLEYRSVLPWSMDDSAKKMMQLFNA